MKMIYLLDDMSFSKEALAIENAFNLIDSTDRYWKNCTSNGSNNVDETWCASYIDYQLKFQLWQMYRYFRILPLS